MTGKLSSVIGVTSLGLLSGSICIFAFGAAEPVSARPVAPVSQADEAAARCAQLTGKVIAGATIDRAELTPEGAKIAPFPKPLTRRICRVDARISPVPGSEIKVQVWLPDRWNGKFVGVGGGGFNGGLASAALALTPLAEQGYAGVATNAGHDVSPTAQWALGNPEKIVDFAHRGNHLGAVIGKATVAAYYGKPATRNLFHGCSNGGRDALMLAQRYPTDYDAIVAGAPANDWTGLMSWFARHEQVARISPGVDLLGPKLNLVHAAAIAKCDALDGAKDGLIERPAVCKFDPAVLQCKSGNDATCLSAGEVAAVKALYRDVRTAGGRLVQPGLPVGSEYQWGGWATAVKSAGGDFARQFYRYMVYEDVDWDVNRFDVSRDFPFARKKVGPVLDAVNPDLRPFLSRGGRLLMYHGWDDAAIPAGNTLNYFGAMRRAVGKLGADRTRLFMLPGVGHCAGGNGPSSVDYLGELDRWAETGVAPERLVASKYDDVIRQMTGQSAKILATRPVCAWPKTAHYKGTGSVSEAQNFVCK